MAKIKILTKEQRHEAGKLLREKCLRTSHGEIVLGQGDKRDIAELIEASNEDRLQKTLSQFVMGGWFSRHLRTSVGRRRCRLTILPALHQAA